MSLDLILRNGHIASMTADAPPADIGIKDGRIVVIEPGLAAEGEELDLGGRMVSPGLVETHIHLDKSRILDRCAPAPNRGREHMIRVAAVKPGFTVEDVYARAGDARTVPHKRHQAYAHTR